METEPDSYPELSPAQVDERALMDIATNLPRYDRVDDMEAVGILPNCSRLCRHIAGFWSSARRTGRP